MITIKTVGVDLLINLAYDSGMRNASFMILGFLELAIDCKESK